MDEGKILLVHLSPQLEEPSRLIGAAILGRLLLASFSRTDTPEKDRRPFMIYADEYQRFATSDFATFLAEARKFKISSTISNQILEQLDDLNRATALQSGTLVVFRSSGDDSKVLTRSFDATPTLQLVGEEPIRAPVADPLSHLARKGHPDKTVATFVSDYLMPLTSLLKSASSSGRLVSLAWAFVLPELLHEGYRQLNTCMARCMREGTASLDIPGLALFVLSGAYAADLTYIFFHHKIKRLGYVPLIGLSSDANTIGRADFLTSETKAMDFLRHCAKTSIFESRATVAWRVAAFLRMLKALRATLAVLAKDPLMTDTGLFQPKYQLRLYADQENQVANDLSQLPNYTAKVRILTTEHTIKTLPAPGFVPEQEVEARIRAIKDRMIREGYTKSAAEVEEEVRKRHEALRARPPGVVPPIRATGRNSRGKQPPQP